MRRVISGIAVSSGISIGPVFKFRKNNISPNTHSITESQMEREKQKVKDAIDSLSEVFLNMIEKNSEKDACDIMVAHLAIIQDPTLENLVNENIVDKKQNSELATYNAIKFIKSQFEMIEDDYFRERAADIDDIGSQLLHTLQGTKKMSLKKLQGQFIIIAEDLSPSDTMNVKKENILGIATDYGGKTSHTSILARNMGIPAIVGMQDIFDNVTDGETVILDAHNGKVIISPTDEDISYYKQKQIEDMKCLDKFKSLTTKKSTTKDGKEFIIAANVGSTEEIKFAIKNGANKIGLFRTEFLYMNSIDFPSEEEQFAAYKLAVELIHGDTVIIRTLDIGGDKNLQYFEFKEELNPFLGYRAIRFCLDNPTMFKTQLRAILRASAYGDIKIMYPMIISVEEIIKSNELLEECKNELREKNIPFNEDIDVGIMIETPAAVMIADVLIEYVDFFSIGTNDLTQYTLAVDRGNESIYSLYNFYHPAIIRSIKRLIDISHEAGKWTGMCGEMAGDRNATKMLIGMGLDEFSMGVNLMTKVKSVMLQTTVSEAEKVADDVLKLKTVNEIEEYLGVKKQEEC